MPSPWPLLLAGPILRRVEPLSVSVWVAVREARTVSLSLYQGITAAGSGSGPMTTTPIAAATQATRRIGARLHLAVVTLKLDPPAQPLQPGTLYAYNIALDGGGTTEDLKTLGLLRDDNSVPPAGRPHKALGYVDNQLPSFALPPTALTDLRIMHGSCRKMHGPGPDAMAAVDHIIAGAREQPDARPHQMFLTGDQVYADEVPIEMSRVLTEVGIELLGGEPTPAKEQVQTSGGPRAVDQREPFAAGGRQDFVTEQARFTTDSGSNHLVSFGEYAAMYLLAWSNALWPPTLPAVAGNQARDERRHLERFRAALPAVRRALANVPTYMILDDHEITDDVYLSQEWRQQVLASPTGRDIVRNAFVAYGLFQAWGNDPAAFATANSPEREFLDQAEALYPAAAATWPVAAAVTELEAMLDMGPPPTGATDPRVSWHYSVGGPRHLVLVLDTRTRRSYESSFASPGLLSREALQTQIPGDPPAVGEPSPFAGPGAARDAGIEVVFVVSPAPVLGLAAVEELAQPGYIKFLDMKAAMRGREQRGRYEKDAEPWAFQPLVFEALLRRLAPLRRVVFLSGDVHFASSAAMSYWDENDNETRFAQFTSSALKNREGLFRVDLLSQPAVQVLFGRVGYPAARNGWISRNPIPVRAPTGGTVPHAYRVALDRDPVALNVFGWPAGTTLTTAPDWAWRMELVADVRPDDATPDARPAAIHLVRLDSDVDPTNPQVALPAVARRHLTALRRQTHRRVVFTSNVGMIRFVGAPPNLSVREDLYSYLPDPTDGEHVDRAFPRPDAFTAHVVSLEPTGAPSPRIPA